MCAFKITKDMMTDAFLEILQTVVWPLVSLFVIVKEVTFSLELFDEPTLVSFSSSVNAQQKTVDS